MRKLPNKEPKKDLPNPKQLQQLAKQLEDELLNSGLPGNAEVGVGLKKLTARETRFVLEYSKGTHKDVRDVATIAGYADPMYGYQLIAKEHIIAELERIQTAKMAVSVLSRDYVLGEVLSLFNDARNDERQDRRTMLSCLDMISKMSGFYSPDTTVNVQNNLSSIKIEIVKPENKEFTDASE